MVVTILALTLCLSTVALFPVDIYLVSRIMNPLTGLRREWATDEAIAATQLVVRIIYYAAYGLIVSFCFFWIPLAYTFFEEMDENQTTLQRLSAACKYTAIFILIAVTLLITGMFMKPNNNENRDLDWLRKMLVDLEGTGALAFVAGVLSLLGMGVLVCYAAPGLSLLPIHLIGGLKSSSEKMSQTNAELAANRERLNAILNRYPQGTNRQVSERDRHAISELTREELVLDERVRIAQGVRDSWTTRCHWIIRPFEIVIGLAATMLTALLIMSISVTTIDNLSENGCGAPCGYILTRPDLPNPLNTLFLKLSPYFPVDYILMVMVILYLFWATTRGVISIGIRFLWLNLFKFRRAATPPQGLLAATVLLMLSLAGMCYSLTMSVAPDYSMFGSQKYCNHTTSATERDCSDYPALIIPCHIGAPEDLCTPTVTSSFMTKIILGTPAFGIAFYYLQWLFLLMFIFGFVFNMVQGFRHGFGVDLIQEEEEDIDDIEARGMRNAIGSMSADSQRRRALKRGLLIPGGGANYGSIQNSGMGTGPGATPIAHADGTDDVRGAR
ncbi:hypothetical protein BGZ99_001885 [Dissophora globulifera]|uniref:Probable lysosomal cobalamin transporter n=1 Tax=Dissophora globulifera TaxID=979702 RepID=A0A9P6RSI7_9FUNG|nr:hypothetical protein BGZ99_001885 [Dissophora globulifera]